uniref:UBA domain-containing protein n=1 Tax=Dulem virus 35 TaxID=3145753 RepID=A0AAU8AYN5_9CAUD
MEYPKPVMKLTELMEMGFPKEFLMTAYRSTGNNFATKINPMKANSAIIFDTQKFDAWNQKQIAAQVKAIPRGGVLS